jgi:hypothetical protein
MYITVTIYFHLSNNLLYCSFTQTLCLNNSPSSEILKNLFRKKIHIANSQIRVPVNIIDCTILNYTIKIHQNSDRRSRIELTPKFKF